jgi:hypothetical protein
LFQSFWANQVVFQMMMADDLFLLFTFGTLDSPSRIPERTRYRQAGAGRMDCGMKTEYRQQIKTFWLKYILLAGKIVQTARRGVMRLPNEYPYQRVYEVSPA